MRGAPMAIGKLGVGGGVDIGQGFLWSKPKQALEAWSAAAAFVGSSIRGAEIVAKSRSGASWCML